MPLNTAYYQVTLLTTQELAVSSKITFWMNEINEKRPTMTFTWHRINAESGKVALIS